MMILIKNIWLKTGIKNWRWIPNITILCTLTYSTAMYLQEDRTYIQIINKSNRVRTTDAFSCVLVLQFVVSIVVLLVLLSLYYLNAVPIVLIQGFIPSLIFILLKKGVFSRFPTDRPTDRLMGRLTDWGTDRPTDWWTDRLTDGWMDRWTDGHTLWSYRDARTHLKMPYSHRYERVKHMILWMLLYRLFFIKTRTSTGSKFQL